MRGVHFLRRQPGQVAAPGVGFEQDLVAQHVQLLLRLALHVDAGVAARCDIAQHAAQRALADRDRDGLAGARHHFDQQPQVGVDAAGALFLDQEARQRDARVRHVQAGGKGRRYCRRSPPRSVPMPRPLLLPAVILLSLAACSPPPAPAARAAPTASAPAPAEAPPAPPATSAATPPASAEPVVAAAGWRHRRHDPRRQPAAARAAGVRAPARWRHADLHRHRAGRDRPTASRRARSLRRRWPRPLDDPGLKLCARRAGSAASARRARRTPRWWSNCHWPRATALAAIDLTPGAALNRRPAADG
jgi:hypothetical protein